MMKKSEQTKTKLVNAVVTLINKGKKISVTSISKESKTAYGTFYRYFNNLDEIHEAAIINVVLEVAESLDKQLVKESSNLFKIYYAWFIAIDLYKDTYTANWLINHPASINEAWILTHPITFGWLQEAIKQKEEPGLNTENLRHFKMASSYIHWTYQNALRELLRGRKSIHVYLDLMNSINFLDLPRKTHKKYLKRVADSL
uniref:Putative transcriptional regulator TetR family protein n=1 Tax=uncultured marine bacterium EB0_49D07 TaxID=415439 RepID=A4GJB2_9BACT|nr:putative transcriptional regulator TetR family protein [uncultured marine bacterium EB0_49D07]